ncbi:Type 1 glutamine amidotransferase-like domain-containing protein [Virgibacillus senegalensis]|uniref:Type 1 glutamine amidotransferase-like domain-containing protein n=1 Tax=Virgibacillus senegalensis TaxID=1499679 RepID=UPI001F450129|nr:Type 1 glutamine amidotransferase-like domain-containing protein [Virgibacillus senegalensis]
MKHLFLFGGTPPFTPELGKLFAEKANQGSKKIAILFLEREGWQAYMSKYTSILEQCGIHHFYYMPLHSKVSSYELVQLSKCSGIIIGGGDTVRYRDYIVDTAIGELIKQLYQSGVPVAGFSAGALLSPEQCVIPPVDNKEGKHLFLPGLGLISQVIISVHYTKWQEEENLLKAIRTTAVPIGYGLDDGAGCYFREQILVQTEGSVNVLQNGRGN